MPFAVFVVANDFWRRTYFFAGNPLEGNTRKCYTIQSTSTTKGRFKAMEKKTTEEKEDQFTEYLQKPPYPVEEMIALIDDVPAAKADEWMKD